LRHSSAYICKINVKRGGYPSVRLRLPPPLNRAGALATNGDEKIANG